MSTIHLNSSLSITGSNLGEKITETMQNVVGLVLVTYCNIDTHANIPAVFTHELYTDCHCTVASFRNLYSLSNPFPPVGGTYPG